jgi:two-component sensor histidine kinase
MDDSQQTREDLLAEVTSLREELIRLNALHTENAPASELVSGLHRSAETHLPGLSGLTRDRSPTSDPAGQILPVRDENGHLVGLLCTERDITAWTQAEQALRQRLALDRLIIKLSLKFIELPPQDVDGVIQQALAEVGDFVGVDHCYVLALSPDKQRLLTIQEWNTAGIGPLFNPLQTADLGPRPWWVQQLQNKPYVYIPRVADLPPEAASERNDLESQGIHSLLCIPMTHRNEIIGFVGFDWLREEGQWAEDDITTLQMLAIVLANALQHKQAEAALQRYATRLEMLHDIDHAVLALESPGDIAAAIVSYIRRVIPCRWASILEFGSDPGTGRLLAIDAEDKTTLDPGAIFTIAPEPLRELTAQHGPFIIKDIHSKAGLDPTAELFCMKGVCSQIGVPLRFKDELFGLLSLGLDNLETLVPDYLDIVGEVGSSLAIALYQARLFETARRDAEARATLLHEMNHRVKNNLSAILGLLYTEQRVARPESQADYRSLLRDLINRVRGLATVHSLLSDAEWGPVLLSELVTHIAHSVLSLMLPHQMVGVAVTPSLVRVSPRQANSMALIINELVTNSAKYALPGQARPILTIRIALTGETVSLEFRDNGSGYPEDVLALVRQGVGLYLIQRLTEGDLHGAMTLHNDHGAVTLIEFKAEMRIAERTTS